LISDQWLERQREFRMADMAVISQVLKPHKGGNRHPEASQGDEYLLGKGRNQTQAGKLEVAEVQNLLLEKDKKIKTLQETLHTKMNGVSESPWYWCVDGGKKNGPFCQQCDDKELELIRLQDYRNGFWGCLSCKNTYDLGRGGSGIGRVETEVDSFSS
jgi:hypothetical protein